ncbi:MAG TPA: hypothetical protein VL360_02990 [Gammaproteobacteria bacterium]|nr:hypothetical protein [Gammaproteobacteria bacterium]
MFVRQQEAAKNVGYAAAFSGFAFGATGYILSGAINCKEYIPQLLNQTYAAANNLAAVTGRVVTNNIVELERSLSDIYIVDRVGMHMTGYLPYYPLETRLLKYSATVADEVVKYTYNLTQSKFMQNCLNAISPSVLVPKFFLFGAVIGAGLSVGYYLFGEETQADVNLEDDQSEDDDVEYEEVELTVQDQSSQSAIQQAVADAIQKEMPSIIENAADKLIKASAQYTVTLFKTQELRKLHDKYGASANFHSDYGLPKFK